MLMDNIELEPVPPFSNRQPCFQLSHLIVGVRRSLFWSTRLLQKSKGGQKPTTGFFNFLLKTSPHWWSSPWSLFRGREGWETSFNLPIRQRWHLSTDAVKLWQCLLHWEINDFGDSQFALVLNWKADFQPTQLFKGICAVWSAVHNLESANSLWRKRRAFENKMSTVKNSFTCIYRSVVRC